MRTNTISTFSLQFTFLVSCSVCFVYALRGAPPGYDVSTIKCAPYGRPDAAKISIPSERVNDDFCDCADGSDEPGTSACSGTANATFYCMNTPHKPAVLPSAYVDDGVCDCCDGSDEPSGRCPDTCKNDRDSAVANAKSRAAAVRAGVVTRAKMARTAAQTRSKNDAELEKKKKELQEVKAQLKISRAHEDGLRAIQKATESIKPKQVEHTDDSQELNNHVHERQFNDDDDDYDYGDSDGEHEQDREQTNNEVQEESNSEKKVAHDATSDDTSSTAEKSGTTQDEEAPSSQTDSSANAGVDSDATSGVNRVVGESADNTSASKGKGVDLGLVCEELGLDSRHRLTRSARMLMLRATTRLRALLGRSGSAEPQEVDRCLERAENRRSELETRESELRSEIDDLEKRVSVDVQGDGALRALHGQCFKKKLAQYEWEHCPFDTVKQYEHGRVIASLGSYDKITDAVIHYNNGAHCWNGPQRSATVTVICGQNNDVINVDEPSRCTYEMIFSTPAVCDEKQAVEILAQVGIQDEKSEL